MFFTAIWQSEPMTPREDRQQRPQTRERSGSRRNSCSPRPAARDLVPAGEAVVELAGHRATPIPPTRDRPGAAFEHEFKREQVELGTRPCQTLDELTAELLTRRRLLADAAHADGDRLLVSGTSPVTGPRHADR